MSNNHPRKGASHRLRKALVVRAINSMAPPHVFHLCRDNKHYNYESFYKRIWNNGRNEGFGGARC